MEYVTNDISDLCGSRKLTGIDRATESRTGECSNSYEDVEVCRLEMDGVVYEFSEDPDDGYRSQHYGPTKIDTPLVNTFAPIAVVCTHVEESTFGFSKGDADVLRVVNAKTGAVILDVGTNDIDDYYPSWICNFSAEALGVSVVKEG